mgnify:CR=1 FL=1
MNEKNCMVKDYVNSGKILKSRYDNYVKFILEKREWLNLKVAVSILSEKDNYKFIWWKEDD